MKKYTPADYRAMPWKNGLGVTTELACAPEGADLDHFEWRVSCAPVVSDSVFSMFRGVDRSLLIRSGAGLVLHVNRQVSFTLTPDSPAFQFAGEDELTAELLDDAVVDFNVMTRRQFWTHSIELMHCLGEFSLQAKGQIMLVYHAQGEAIDLASGVRFLPHELLELNDVPLRGHSPRLTTLYVVRLYATQSAPII